MPKSHFDAATFRFLERLARNNERDWFNAHKAEFEHAVQGPLLQFIADFASPLEKISGHYRADPKKVGGSAFRIYRDVRFSKNKTPYKTWAAARFRHEAAPAHPAPSFYLHVQPQNCFLGAGLWRPQPKTLARIRHFIADNPRAWTAALTDRRFRRVFALSGQSLKRPPRGFDPDHPLIEDLKRKDFVAIAALADTEVTSAGFMRKVADRFQRSAPLMDYLCAALDLDF